MSINDLRKKYPWPDCAPPKAIPDLVRGNVRKGLDDVVALLKDIANPIVIEVGSELGGGARKFVDDAGATVICLDKWPVRGYGNEWKHALKGITSNPKYGTLGAFAKLCDKHKDSIICIKGDRLDGLRDVHKFGIKPDMVYVDCIHMYKPLLSDLELIHSLFPDTIIAGDDWRKNKNGKYYPVQHAVKDFAKNHSFDYEVHDNQYVISKEG